MEQNPLGREAAAQRQPQFTPRADVEPGAFFLQNGQNRRAEVSLPGIDDAPLRIVLREGRRVLASYGFGPPGR